jgi:hypothetical protein
MTWLYFVFGPIGVRVCGSTLAVACAECEGGFYRLSGTCEKCPSTDAALVAVLAAVVFCIFAPAIFKLAETMRNFPSINVGISFQRSLGLFAASIPYPRNLFSFLSGFSIFNLNLELIHPDCTLESWDFSGKWMWTSLMPIIFLGVSAVFVLTCVARLAWHQTAGLWIKEHYGHWLMHVRDGQKLNALVKFRRALGFALVGTLTTRDQLVKIAHLALRAQLTFYHVVYVFLSQVSLELWDCTKNTADGNHYLDAEPSVRCGWPYGANADASAAWWGPYSCASSSPIACNRSTYQVKPFYLSSETVLPIK